MRKWKILLVMMMSIMSAEAFCCHCVKNKLENNASVTSDCGCRGAEAKCHKCH